MACHSAHTQRAPPLVRLGPPYFVCGGGFLYPGRIAAKRRQWFPSTTGDMVGASPVSKLSLKPANPKILEIRSAGATSVRPKSKLGLRAWMERVLVECGRAAAGFGADRVHYLWGALRRGRS